MPLHPLIVKTKLFKPLLFLARPFYKTYNYMSYLEWVSFNKNKGYLNDYYNRNAKYKNRYILHDTILSKLNLINIPIDYYEFGVAKGDMIKYWASKNKHPESRFIGYDSFEGLPESWEDKEVGHFDTKGFTPETNDVRISFVKGWFQDSVYNDLKNRNFINQSVFHLDADIFSSTLYVLFQLHIYMKPNDILIFDEFSNFNHEFLAFEIFKKCTGRDWKYEFIGSVNNNRQIAYRIK